MPASRVEIISVIRMLVKQKTDIPSFPTVNVKLSGVVIFERVCLGKIFQFKDELAAAVVAWWSLKTVNVVLVRKYHQAPAR